MTFFLPSVPARRLCRSSALYHQLKSQHLHLMQKYHSSIRYCSSSTNRKLMQQTNSTTATTGSIITPLSPSGPFGSNPLIRRHYSRGSFQPQQEFTNAKDSDVPDFPPTKEATWVFYQHIQKYFNEHAWEYYGLKDVIKGLLIDFRVQLEKALMDIEEKQSEILMAKQFAAERRKRGEKASVLDLDEDTESDPEDLNELLNNPSKLATKPRLKDLVEDPEIERTVYADFLIEISERIPDVFEESLNHLNHDEATIETTKEQFGDLISSLEMHIHSMGNLTRSPEIPDWMFEKYRVTTGPVIYNRLLDASVRLGDTYAYSNLMRKMKNDNIGLNQESFRIMMQFGEKSKKNNLIYAKELMKYMQERKIEPDEETLTIYKRILDKFGTQQQKEEVQKELEDVYSTPITGKAHDDTVPDIRKDLVDKERGDVGDRLDVATENSEDIMRNALASQKYKEEMLAEEKRQADSYEQFEMDLFNEFNPENQKKKDQSSTQEQEAVKQRKQRPQVEDILNPGQEDNSGDPLEAAFSKKPMTPDDDLPPLHNTFASNAAAQIRNARPLHHPAHEPLRFNVQDGLNEQAELLRQEMQRTRPVRPEQFKKVDDDETVLRKLGLTPEDLEQEYARERKQPQPKEFNQEPGSREDMEEVRDASKEFLNKHQEDKNNADSLYAAQGNYYDTGFFDPYAQPMKGYDSNLANEFTEEDFYTDDPYKDNRKVITKKDDLIFDAYAENDIEAELRQKQEILKQQLEKEKAAHGEEEDEGEDTFCSPNLKL